MEETRVSEPFPVRSRLQRWLLAGIGVVMVAIGALGVVVPGLPTTVFLIAASWCFARSCPWLEERLIRVPLFRPFLGYLEPGQAMPRRTVITTLAVMWCAISLSSGLLAFGETPRIGLSTVIIGLGIVGTVFVVRMGRRRISEPTPPPAEGCDAEIAIFGD
jgi:uncharacterized membrane protein YbaN (DUF454 family)